MTKYSMSSNSEQDHICAYILYLPTFYSLFSVHLFNKYLQFLCVNYFDC